MSILEPRIVPVGEDLTKEDLRLSVLRGMEKMYRVDKAAAPGVSLSQGQWGMLQPDGKVVATGATPTGPCFVVFSGNDRFDGKATGQVTLIMTSPVVIKSSVYDTVPSYVVGDMLTVKSGKVTKHTGTLPRYGRVLEANSGAGYLVYETLAGV